MSILNYSDFLFKKTHVGIDHGFEPNFMPDALFPFQKKLVEWACLKGRAALFEDCGLGKTLQQLVWAENVCRHTNGNVLILTPLAVSSQTVAEAEKFDIDAKRSNNGEAHKGITITNYEKIHFFDPENFQGVVCDESSILKNFDGVRRKQITGFMRKIPYRLLATATAAPNDYTELGTSSEALGYMGHMDMLNRFFRNEQNNTSARRMYGEANKWRFKGHAEMPFWRWVTSWARAIRKPSDIGFDDGDFLLSPLGENIHLVDSESLADGFLFPMAAVTLPEQRKERKRTIKERCEKVASLVADTNQPALVWCNLNDEGTILNKMIPGAEEIKGSDSDDKKEDKFTRFISGDIRVLVTKPKIGAWGLNFQHCNHETYFPTHSYEQYYQAARRCWRFGQKRPVTIDIVMTEGDRAIMDNLRKKMETATIMFENLVDEMNRSISIDSSLNFNQKEELPSWL